MHLHWDSYIPLVWLGVLSLMGIGDLVANWQGILSLIDTDLIFEGSHFIGVTRGFFDSLCWMVGVDLPGAVDVWGSHDSCQVSTRLLHSWVDWVIWLALSTLVGRIQGLHLSIWELLTHVVVVLIALHGHIDVDLWVVRSCWDVNIALMSLNFLSQHAL